MNAVWYRRQVEIPAQWMLEDWEQFAFNADPHWGVIPEDCAKVVEFLVTDLSGFVTGRCIPVDGGWVLNPC